MRVNTGLNKYDLEKLSKKVLDASFMVHSYLGPGLLESAYEACLRKELRDNGVEVDSQVTQHINYKGEIIDVGYRLDLLVERSLIVEIKAVETIRPLHKAQLLSYLRLRGLHLGLLINFNTVSLKDGISRIINGYY
jgi:GxxExxY protein